MHTEEYMKKVTLAIAAVALLAISSEVNASTWAHKAKASASKLATNA